jgi:hypothetical protein
MSFQELTKLEGFAFLEYLELQSAIMFSHNRSHDTHITTAFAWKNIVSVTVLRTTVQVVVDD